MLKKKKKGIVTPIFIYCLGIFSARLKEGAESRLHQNCEKSFAFRWVGITPRMFTSMSSNYSIQTLAVKLTILKISESPSVGSLLLTHTLCCRDKAIITCSLLSKVIMKFNWSNLKKKTFLRGKRKPQGKGWIKVTKEYLQIRMKFSFSMKPGIGMRVEVRIKCHSSKLYHKKDNITVSLAASERWNVLFLSW